MMKSTLIKDLYGEIERLKAGVLLFLCCGWSTLDWLNQFFRFFAEVPYCWLNLWLLSEVYATREKNGVYIPKDRYYQEENEKKVVYSVFVCLLLLQYEYFIWFI